MEKLEWLLSIFNLHYWWLTIFHMEQNCLETVFGPTEHMFTDHQWQLCLNSDHISTGICLFYFVLGSWPCHKQVWLMCCFLTQALLLYHLLSSFIIKKREWLLSNSTDTEATIIKEKQAPQINTISRWKRYNKNWRKINKSKHPELSKASINISWQTSCRAVAYSTISQNLSLW